MVVNGFDHSSTMRLAFNVIFARQVILKLFAYSKSLDNRIVCIKFNTENCLLINLRLLHQSYECRETTEVLLIPSDENPADLLTEKNASPTLQVLLSNSKHNLHTKKWAKCPVKKSRRNGDVSLPLGKGQMSAYSTPTGLAVLHVKF